MLKDPLVTQNLINTIHDYLNPNPQVRMSTPLPERGVRNVVKKKRTNREFKFRVEIDNYEMDDVILELGSDVSILTKKTWEQLGKTSLSSHRFSSNWKTSIKYTLLGEWRKWKLI